MAERTVAQKARVKPGARVAVLNPEAGVVESLGLPEDVEVVGPRDAELLLLFVRARAELDTLMPAVVADLGADAALWVFFRKGSRAAGLDMSRNDVWAAAEKQGLRPLGLIGVDDAWSVFRLRRAR